MTSPAKTFRVLRSGPLPGPRNMALDEALMGHGGPVRPTLRLYRWLPWTLTLGRFQAVEQQTLQPFRERGWSVTRRSTGGGAIFHADELTYSLVLPARDGRIPVSTTESYHWVHSALVEALRGLGVEAAPRRASPAAGGEDPFFCFDRTASIDLVAGQGRKIVGSAQRRTATAFLQHGSLLLGDHPTSPGSVSLEDLAGTAAMGPGRVEDALVAAFARLLDATAEEGEPDAEETSRADHAEDTRYGATDWVESAGRRGGRPTPRPRFERVPGSPPPEPLWLLAATPEAALGAVGPGLRITGSRGGRKPLLDGASVTAIEACRVRRRETRTLLLERDPWDSTFTRSHFDAPPTGLGFEGAPPRSDVVEDETTLIGLLHSTEGPCLLDARRFNYSGLGEHRTGDWSRDLETLLGHVMAMAGAAARGPGLRSLLAGRRPFLLGSETELTRALLQLAAR